MDETVDTLEWLRAMRTVEGDMYQQALDKAIEAIREQASVSDAAEAALSKYYDNGDPELLVKLAKELVR